MKTAMMTASLAALLLSACGSEPAADKADTDIAASPSADTVAGDDQKAAEPGTPPASPAALTLEGYGGLTIGTAVPASSGWAERGAQISDGCSTISSPDWPDAYAIVEDGVVRRITASDGSKAKLVEGIGPGSTEAQVRAAFPSFVATPHKYIDAPAKYLTQPGNDPRLRFEIDADSKVSLVHIGMMPTLEYVEGCA